MQSNKLTKSMRLAETLPNGEHVVVVTNDRRKVQEILFETIKRSHYVNRERVVPSISKRVDVF